MYGPPEDFKNFNDDNTSKDPDYYKDLEKQHPDNMPKDPDYYKDLEKHNPEMQKSKKEEIHENMAIHEDFLQNDYRRRKRHSSYDENFYLKNMIKKPYYSYSEDKIEPYDSTQSSNYHDLYAYSKLQIPPL